MLGTVIGHELVQLSQIRVEWSKRFFTFHSYQGHPQTKDLYVILSYYQAHWLVLNNHRRHFHQSQDSF